MKLTAILLLGCCLHVSAKTEAQGVTISDKKISVEQVFSQIRKQTGYDIIYNPDYFKSEKYIKNGKYIAIDVKNAPVESVLDLCLKGLSLTYEIKYNTIIVKEIKGRQTGQATGETPLATVTISGSVADSSGAPLIGASVVIKGTKIGTVTKEGGRFTLTSPVNSGVILVSYTGYTTQEARFSGETALAITLKLDEKAVGESIVVVSVGYGTLNKKEVTTSVSHLSAKQLLSVGGNSGALMSMQGKVPGLTISNTNAADPNSTPSVQLQGVSSRNAGVQPLYIINGVPGGNPLNLNPNNIESIDVLQGGAAAAIYGTRGSNGVIIITTKKGVSTPTLMVDSYLSFDFANNKLKPLSADEFIKYTSGSYPAAINRGTNYGYKTDWFKEITNNPAVGQKHTVQFSGGSDRTTYLASMDYKNSNGIDIRATRKEYGGQLIISHQPKNKLFNLSLNVAPRFVSGNNADYGSETNSFTKALTLNPTLPVYDTLNPSRLLYILGVYKSADNPLDLLKLVKSQFKSFYLDWSGSVKLNILNNLYSTVTLGQSYINTNGMGFTPSNSIYSYQYNIATHSGQPTASQSLDVSSVYNFDWTGNYSLRFRNHSIGVLGGYSYSYFNNNGFSANGGGYPSDDFLYNNLGAGDPNYIINNPNGRLGSYRNDSKLIAFFGRINYSLADKYYATFSLRHEGSSKFGPSKQWGNFPGASIAWRLSQESFMKNIPWINDLKLRADFGVTGNQDFSSYQSLYLYSGYGYYPYLGTNYQVYGPSQLRNLALQWETTQSYNFGVDFELWNRRLTGSINYFTKLNKNLLGQYPVPIPVGTPNNNYTSIYPPTSAASANVYANVGTMKNWGIQIQLNAKVINNKDFQYSVSFTGATLGNKLVSLSNQLYNGGTFYDDVNMAAPGSAGFAQRIEEGKRVGNFYMYRSAGDSAGTMMIYSKSGKVIPAYNGTLDDKRYVGNGLPKFTASLGNTFTYKNLDLSIFFRGAFGYKVFNTFAFYIGTPVLGADANSLTSAYDPGSRYSKLTDPKTYTILSDYFLENGSFVKIDNVALGYTLNFKDNRYIKSIRLYATGRNLKAFTSYTGGDPEVVPVNGLTPGIIRNYAGDLKGSITYYPSTLQLLAGLQVNF